MKKLLLLTSFIVCGLAVASAQDYREVVYLKNGSIIRGIIVEQIPNVSLKIKTTSGDVYDYDIDEVDKIAKEFVEEKAYRSRGYQGYVDIGCSVGLVNWSGCNAFSLSTSHGYQFNPYLFIGAGIGIDYYRELETTMLPIFADLKVNFIKNDITPFFRARLGYSLIDGTGVYFNPTIGVDISPDKDWGFLISLGYNMQYARFYDWTPFWEYLYWESINTLSFKLGLYF